MLPWEGSRRCDARYISRPISGRSCPSSWWPTFTSVSHNFLASLGASVLSCARAGARQQAWRERRRTSGHAPLPEALERRHGIRGGRFRRVVRQARPHEQLRARERQLPRGLDAGGVQLGCLLE